MKLNRKNAIKAINNLSKINSFVAIEPNYHSTCPKCNKLIPNCHLNCELDFKNQIISKIKEHFEYVLCDKTNKQFISTKEVIEEMITVINKIW